MVHSVRPVLPIVPLVVRLRPELEVLRRDTRGVETAVAHHDIPADDSSFQDTQYEAIGSHLASVEL